MTGLEERIADVVRQAVRDALDDLDPAEVRPVAYTTEQAADALGVSRSTVQRLIADGRLRTVRLGARVVRIPRIALDELVSPTTTTQPAVTPVSTLPAERDTGAAVIDISQR